MFGRRRHASGGTRRRTGLRGCLLWILILLAVLLVLGLLFGGFRKGSGNGSLPRPFSSARPVVTALAALPGYRAGAT